MLRLWPERLSIELSPQACRVESLTRWGKPSLMDEVAVPAPVDPRQVPWQAATEALERLLSERKQARGEVQIVLADAFARYVSLRWSDSLRNSREVDALAKARFEEVYGDRAHEWHIVADMREYGRDGLACAIDAHQVEELHEIAAHRNLQITSLCANFVDVSNRFRKRISENAVLAVGMDESWTLACRQHGNWRNVRPVSSECISTSVKARMQRELLWLGIGEEMQMLVCARNAEQLVGNDDGVMVLPRRHGSNEVEVR